MNDELKYVEQRYDELLNPFSRLVTEILADTYPNDVWPNSTRNWNWAWNEYVQSLNEIVRVFFPLEDWDLDES